MHIGTIRTMAIATSNFRNWPASHRNREERLHRNKERGISVVAAPERKIRPLEPDPCGITWWVKLRHNEEQRVPDATHPSATPCTLRLKEMRRRGTRYGMVLSFICATVLSHHFNEACELSRVMSGWLRLY